MKKFYCFEVDPGVPMDEAWSGLEAVGVELAYASEDVNSKIIYGYVGEQTLSLIPDSVLLFKETTLPAIDWKSQWEVYGLDFYDGFVHIDLNLFGLPTQKIIRLEPGPGFGDLSHPTTLLVLRFMSKYVKGKAVVDIGCGSGVLSLAACELGASRVDGVDIDQEALNHSASNAKINGLETACQFHLPENFIFFPDKSASPEPVVILMNMITSEQRVAWHSLSTLHGSPSICIVSGIRSEERDPYLNWTKTLGWKVNEEREEEGWLAFVFS
jgi:ribosomal protein L11 methyltransferase